MIEGLNHLKGDTIIIILSDAARACILHPLKQEPGEDVLMLLMPMQLP